MASGGDADAAVVVVEQPLASGASDLSFHLAPRGGRELLGVDPWNGPKICGTFLAACEAKDFFVV